MSTFVEIDVTTDAGRLEQEVYEAIAARFEGWLPAEGNLEVWLTKAFARIGAQLNLTAAEITKAAFQAFGEKVVGEPPILASPATVETVWTMVDEAGYTIPAGTQVLIAAAGDVSVGFVVPEDIVVAPGATKVAVTLRAAEPGSAANELTADPQLSDSLAFVAGIETEGESTGGLDEEEEDAYLGRLAEVLQTKSTSLILPRDFEIDARSQPPCARALCIPNYNPEDETTDNPFVLCTFPIDASDNALTVEEMAAMQAHQEALVLSEITPFVAAPDYTEIDVSASIVIEPGFDPATVIAAVEARLDEYFSKWGMPTQGNGGSGWINRPNVYRFELVSEIDRVGGVDRVVTLKLAKHGEGLDTPEEIELEGVAPLTRPGTFTITEA